MAITMTKKRYFIVSFMLLIMSVNTWSAGVRLLELLVDQTKLVSLLGKKGVEGTLVNQVQSSVQNSLFALRGSQGEMTAVELKKTLTQLKALPEDGPYQRNLLYLLDRDVNQITKEELAEAVNNLIYLANRYGYQAGTILACSACVSKELGEHGFKFTFEEIKDTNIRQVLHQMVPRTPRALKQKISQWMSRLGAGSFTVGGKSSIVGAEELRSFGLFLAMAQKNSPATTAQREFINGVLAVSRRPDGNLKLVDPQNPHKLWNLFSEKEVDEKFLKEFTAVLNETAQKANSQKQINKENVFFATLRQRAGDNPDAQQAVRSLERKGCFFLK